MFSIEPFTAEHLAYRDDGNGGLKATREQVRVIGVTEKDGEPHYVVEVYKNGRQWLECEAMLSFRE